MIRLKELRGNKTQEYIANELGLIRGTYRGYESGIRQPDPDMLIKMARYFNVSVDFLIGNDVNYENKVNSELYVLISQLDSDEQQFLYETIISMKKNIRKPTNSYVNTTIKDINNILEKVDEKELKLIHLYIKQYIELMRR